MDISQIYNLTNNLPYYSFYNKVELPYSFDDIKIQSNELASHLSINQSLNKLFENYLYLYGWTKFASTVTPLSSFGIAGVYNNIFSWYNSVSSDQFGLHHNNLDNMSKLLPINKDGEIYVATGSNEYFTILDSSADFSSITPVFSSYQAVHGSSYNFLNISSIAYLNNRIYILDSENNAIFLYNIEFTPTKLSFVKTLNGQGTFNDNSKYHTPIDLCISSDIVYVLDSGNRCIKMYDPDLNWVNTFNIAEITSNLPIALTVQGNSIYITTNKNEILIFDIDFNNLNIVIPNISLNETIKNIFVAKSNDNIFYIVTDSNIYKCNKQSPEVYINKFNQYRFGIVDESFVYADSVAYGDQDYIFCISVNNTTNASKIIQFTDRDDSISNLTEETFDIYGIDTIKVRPDDYNESFTFNRSFYLLLINHYELQKRIKGKFVGTYDTENNIYLLNIDYIVNDIFDNINLNLYIGQNELFSNSVVNRCLQQIFNIQVDIKDKLTPIIKDSVTSLNTPVVLT